MTESLITRYRPKTFDEVVGHETIVRALKASLGRSMSRQFLFVGPAGLGKTSIARILASEVGCKKPSEIDAATYTGAEDMRAVAADASYKPLMGQSKVIIIDEAHRISAAAWASLLKPIEEPPPNVYWVLCTTDVGKVPQTIKTRCQLYEFRPLSDDEIWSLLVTVCELEKFDTPDEVLDSILNESQGSPRQALNFLSACFACTTREEAAPILRSSSQSKEVIDLCRFLVKPGAKQWRQAMVLLKSISDPNAESTRISIVNYLSVVLCNTKDEKEAVRLLRYIDSFSKPYNPSDKMAPLLLSLGEVVYASE